MHRLGQINEKTLDDQIATMIIGVSMFITSVHARGVVVIIE